MIKVMEEEPKNEELEDEPRPESHEQMEAYKRLAELWEQHAEAIKGNEDFSEVFLDVKEWSLHGNPTRRDETERMGKQLEWLEANLCGAK